MYKQCAVVVMWLIMASMAYASETGVPEILLWQGDAPGAKGYQEKDQPSMLVYRAPEEIKTGASVIICPGGGYWKLAVNHEGHDVARWLNSFGVTAFILKYRHAPDYQHPIPLGDAQRAIRWVRAKSNEYGIKKNRIGILGFSAGGHLTSSSATHFDSGNPNAEDQIERESCRPDFAILLYPVISFVTEYTHKGSKKNLLGENPDPELVKHMSSELQVTSETPPCFLMHAGEDTGVPPENSVLFYMACRKAGVPAEIHIFEKGKHGFGLAPNDPVLNQWPGLCETWMRKRGLLETES